MYRLSPRTNIKYQLLSNFSGRQTKELAARQAIARAVDEKLLRQRMFHGHCHCIHEKSGHYRKQSHRNDRKKQIEDTANISVKVFSSHGYSRFFSQRKCALLDGYCLTSGFSSSSRKLQQRRGAQVSDFRSMQSQSNRDTTLEAWHLPSHRKNALACRESLGLMPKKPTEWQWRIQIFVIA